jgi:hypothetical protein
MEMKKLLPLLLLVSGCADSTTYLKNEKTGEAVKCGGVHAVTLAESAIQQREAQCIQDYKERGFVRIPGPDSK